MRAKCPGCGRVRSVDADEATGAILCPACGVRYDAASAVVVPKRPNPPPPAARVPQPTVAPPRHPHLPLALAFAVLALFALVVGIGFSALGWRALHRPQPEAVRPPATRPSPVVRPTTIAIRPLPPVERPATASATLPVVVVAPKPTTVAAAPPPYVFHPVKTTVARDDLDARIGTALTRGIDSLLARFIDGRLAGYADPSEGAAAGADALAVYALLQAARSTDDVRLIANAKLTDDLLRELKRFEIDRGNSVYGRSLRAQALGVYARPADKAALRHDAEWLIAAGRNGAYSYDPVPKERMVARLPFGPTSGTPVARAQARLAGNWDNSNSQYGAYGVWAAADAGVEVSLAYWAAVRQHWTDSQLVDGEWPYLGGGPGSAYGGRTSMTVAGITSLLVAEDQTDVRDVVAAVGHPPFTPALARGLDWIEAGDRSVALPAGSYRTYGLYGVERAALASGFKRFGTHDWYRELAAAALARQAADGSWNDGDPVVDTAFTLLFLARGRHPVLMNKLRYDGFWANRPRDVANLARFATRTLERPFNWQVVTTRNGWVDWTDAPVLFVAGHQAVPLTDADVAGLRAYAENGGLIFTHADGDSPEFTAFVEDLAKRLFPAYPLADLPPDHPVYSSFYRLKPPLPRLQGVSNGSRLLLVHTSADLNKAWQVNDPAGKPTPFDAGLNVFAYAAGKSNWRNKLDPAYVPEPAGVRPVLTTTVARVKYDGNWNPEPAALPRFARLLLPETGVKLDFADVPATGLDAAKMPVAFLTGTATVRLTDADETALHDYVAAGGVLVVDAAGGSADFNQSVHADVLPGAFPRDPPQAMSPDDPFHAGTGEGMTPLTDRLRPGAAERLNMATAPLQSIAVGRGRVLVSTVDLTTGLLGTATWPVVGYTPDESYAVVRNALLFALERQSRAMSDRATSYPTSRPADGP